MNKNESTTRPKSLISWMASNSVAANLLMLVILFLGLWSMNVRLPLEVFPAFEGDIIQVQVTYRGASPEESMAR